MTMRTAIEPDPHVDLPTLKPVAGAHAASEAGENNKDEPIVWDWDVEHADRAREREADAAVHNALPFQVDRSVLKSVVNEKMGEEVVRIRFMGSGVSTLPAIEESSRYSQ
jgi:hypothetical protein